MFWNKGETELRRILESSKSFISVENYKDSVCYIDNNEFLLTLEVLCDQIFELNEEIPPDLSADIISLGKKYNLDSKRMDFIEKLAASK